MINMQQNIRIGTSNIVVPGNKQSFPPPYNLKSRLHYYAHYFNTIEINQTFYKLPKPATFERWAGETGDGFKFSLKLFRDITHQKDLKGNLYNIDQFFYAAGKVGLKHGCLLLQFPGKITLEYFNEVEAIMERVAAADERKQWQIAVELRDRSWHTGETYELLNGYLATLVIHDMPRSGITENFTDASCIYLRFHGPQGDYRGTYSQAFLQQKATHICNWAGKGKEVYVYFNNTIGNAFNNARTLMDMIQEVPL